MGVKSQPFSRHQLVMPDFTRQTAEFSHTIDSAMHVLDAMGIAESRFTLRMAGPGQRPLQIVHQSPPPGAPLGPSVMVTLWISGFGLFDYLPQPMRESGGEAEMGTRELCSLFDDPLQKSARWFRTGLPLFDIAPEKHAACRRWISLFGLDVHSWPDEMLYPLALLAPTLARMAGREIGIRLAFLTLLGLPIHGYRYQRAWRNLEPRERSELGAQRCRLGRDFIAGDRQHDVNSAILELGPVSLDTYAAFQTEHGDRLLQGVMQLCMSAYQSYSIAWMIEDASQLPRLGVSSQNSRIGLNFHLGQGAHA